MLLQFRNYYKWYIAPVQGDSTKRTIATSSSGGSYLNTPWNNTQSSSGQLEMTDCHIHSGISYLTITYNSSIGYFLTGTSSSNAANVIFADVGASTNTYSITYNSNYGDNTTLVQSSNEGSQVTLKDNSAFTRDGYTIGSWTTASDGSGFSYSPGIQITLNENMTLYAQWRPVEYNITYNLDGGTNDAGNPDKYTIESSDITLKNPTKSGYTFKGWYNNAQLIGNPVTTIARGTFGNMTLYAKWESNNTNTATLSYNANEGSGSVPGSRTVNKGTTVTVASPGSDLSREGYELKTNKVWNTKADGTGVGYNAGDTIS